MTYEKETFTRFRFLFWNNITTDYRCSLRLLHQPRYHMVSEGTQVRIGLESVSAGESSAYSASQVVRINSLGQSTIENIGIPRLRPTISSTTRESSASSASQVVRMNSVGQSTIENIVIPRLRPTISSTTRESPASQNNRGYYDFNRIYAEPPLREGRNTVVRFKSLRLQWTLANPCPHCGCVLFFAGDELKIRQKCCSNGQILRSNNSYPHLKPLPPALLNYCLNYKNHMGRNAVSYNNLLSLGACGIENESETGGFETIHGDHSLLLHGRTYHFLPNNTRTGGLYFFTYDAMQEMQSYGDRTMNTRNENGEIKHYLFYGNIGEALYNHEQVQINYLVRECIAQGNLARQEIMPRLNLSTTAFDVASIVSEDANRPNRRIVFQLKNEPYIQVQSAL